MIVFKKVFSYRPFIVAAFMIVYGFTAIYIDELADINEIKEQVWTEAPHKKVSIDNYLQLLLP